MPIRHGRSRTVPPARARRCAIPTPWTLLRILLGLVGAAIAAHAHGLAFDVDHLGLFHFRSERGRELPDDLTPGLRIDDPILKQIIKQLIYNKNLVVYKVLYKVVKLNVVYYKINLNNHGKSKKNFFLSKFLFFFH